MASPHATDFADRMVPSVRRRERRRGQDLVILPRHRAPTSGPREGVVEQPALTALVSKSLHYSQSASAMP